MDLITLAMAKKYTDEKAGYVETTAPITFDGDETGKEVLSTNEGKFVTIGKVDGLDLNTVASVTLRSRLYDDAFVLEKQHMTVQTVENTQGLRYTNAELEMEGLLLALIVNGYLAVLSDLNDTDYVARIEFAETIHTIDPKFLPGVCLPVVELSTAVGGALTEAESAKLNEVAATGLPCVIRFTFEGMQMAAAFSFTDMGGFPMYSHTFGTMFIQIISDGTEWSANAETVQG